MKKIGESYTINYILITGVHKLHDTGAEASILGHKPQALHVSDEHEVVRWVREFNGDTSSRLLSIVKHTDEIFDTNDVNRIYTCAKELAAQGRST